MERNEWKNSQMRRGALRRALSLVLTLPMLAGALLVPGYAAPKPVGEDGGIAQYSAENPNAALRDKARLEKHYALTVTTGQSTSTVDQIKFIAVRYVDEQGSNRKKYIMLCEGDSSVGQNQMVSLAESAGCTDLAGERLDQVARTTGYTPTAMSEQEPFTRQYGTDTFFFETDTAIQTVTGVDLFVKACAKNYNANKEEKEKGIKDSWTCLGLRVYQVDYNYGMDVAGYYSEQYFGNFEGKLLAQLRKTGTDETGMEFNWEVDMRIPIGEGREGYMYTGFDRNEVYDSEESAKEYYVELAFEDFEGAGVESLVNFPKANGPKEPNTITQMGLYEPLDLQVQYRDIYGAVREVHLPVVTSSVSWALANRSDTEGEKQENAVHGIAQQGQTLGFTIKLPDLQEYDDSGYLSLDKTVKYFISYGGSRAEAAAGISTKSTVAAERRKLNTDEANESKNPDHIQLAYMTISKLDGRDTQPTAHITGGNLYCQRPGNPDFYYAQTREEVKVNTTTDAHKLSPFHGEKIGAQKLEDSYLVLIQTDDMERASTTAEVKARFGYVNTNGVQTTTQPVNVKEAMRNYIGLVPGEKKGVDVAYQQSMSAGGTVAFLITVSDVDHFTSAVLELAATTDDWQIKDIQIVKLSKLSERMCTWWSDIPWDTLSPEEQTTMQARFVSTSEPKWFTDRSFYRIYEGKDAFHASGSELIQGGDSKEISGSGTGDDTGGGGEEEPTQEKDIDWSDSRTSMTYAEACRNLGFNKSRKNYTVVVKVDSDLKNVGGDDDCGSRNQFFFQLVFKGGSSGYVLANQQLGSDRFRSGYEESFVISTNHNYGELVSVNIIPDDLSNASDIYDKLKIDEIRVVLDSNSTVSKSWVVKNVGWVSIDYRDDGEVGSPGGREGRSAAQLARTFHVSYSTYEVNLQFALTTKQYTDADKVQMQAYVTGTLQYYDGSKQLRKMPFDVVQKMSEYANKAPDYPIKTGVDGVMKEDTTHGAMSDPDWMFRGNSTDRFILSVDDVSSLYCLDLRVEGINNTEWNVGGLSVSTIPSEGSLLLNSNNEYVRKYKEEPQEVDHQEGMATYQLPVMKGSYEKLSIYFEGNNIEVKEITEEEGGWTTVVTREPVSTNDTLDLYVFPAAVDNAEKPGNYGVRAALQFNTIGDKLIQSSVEDLKWSEEKGCYYAAGIRASNFITLNQLGMVATGEYLGIQAPIDYAVVRHTRDGVVLDTFYFDCKKVNIGYQASVQPSAYTALPDDKQTVMLQTAPGRKTTQLLDDKVDIAIAIQYTSTLDSDGRVYSSPYTYLTDVDCRSITDGDLLKVNFHQPFVDEIKGVRAVSLSDLELSVTGGVVAKYEDKGLEKPTCTEWYTLGDPDTITRGGTTMIPTSIRMEDTYALTPVTLTLTGSGESVGSDPGPVRVTIGYRNYFGGNNQCVLQDIRDYVGSAGLNRNGNLSATLLLEGVKDIRYVTIEPYSDTGDIGVLELSSVRVEMENLDQSVSMAKAVEEVAYQGRPITVSFAPVVLDTTVHVPASGELGASEMTVRNSSASLLVESGTTLTADISISGSEDGFLAEVVAVEGDAIAAVSGIMEISGNTITLKMPDNTSGSPKSYRLTITSAEIPTVNCQVTVTVRSRQVIPEPVNPEIPEPGLENNSGENTEDAIVTGETDSGTAAGGDTTGGEAAGGDGSENVGEVG